MAAHVCSTQDGEDLCRRLLAAGMPAEAVEGMAKVQADAHIRHRATAAEIGA